MRVYAWLTGLALIFGVSTIAQAAPFADVDSDGDGLVTPAEFVAAYPDLSADVWNAIDADGDGAVTPEEHQTAADEGLLPNA